MCLGETERRLHDAFAAGPPRRARACSSSTSSTRSARSAATCATPPGATWSTSCWPSSTAPQADNEGVFVLAATNHPWDVDTALRRPGRLDRTLLVLPPDEPARAAILAAALERPPGRRRRRGKLARHDRRLLGRRPRRTWSSPPPRPRCRSRSAPASCCRSPAAHAPAARRELRPSTRPWFSIAHNYAHLRQRVGRVRRPARLHPEEQAAVNDDLAHATALLDLNRPERAVELLRRVIASTPADAHAHALLASAYLQLGRHQAALGAATTAAALEPDVADGHRLRAIALRDSAAIARSGPRPSARSRWSPRASPASACSRPRCRPPVTRRGRGPQPSER